MKKLFISFAFIGIAIFPINVWAAGATDAATLSEQLFQMGELIPINSSTIATSINTQSSMLKTVILDPIANQMINAALQSMSNDIMAWANGGFNGEPLIISNPEKYIQSAGLKQVKISLNFIPEGTNFGDSIFKSFARKYSFQNSDMKTKVEELSKDDMPSIIRRRNCNDEMLTTLATRQIEANGGTFDNNEMVRIKNELNDYICEGDINDPEVVARLNELEENNPEISGDDGWLCVTMGNCNDYVKSVRMANVIEEDKAMKETMADKDIHGGTNAVSQKSCSEYSNPPDGEEPVCIGTESIATPSSIVTSVISKAMTSGQSRTENLTGEGAFTALLDNFVRQYLGPGLNEAVNPNAGSHSNNSSAVISQKPFINNLVGDPGSKASLIQTMMKQFTLYKKSLTDLEQLDQDYLADISVYEAKVREGAACYDALVQNGQISNTDPKVLFYENRLSRIEATRNSINAELPKILEARALVDQTITKINASNSSEEIGQLFNKYLSAIDTGSLPTIQSLGERRGEYYKTKSEMNNDSDVTKYLNQCKQLSAGNSNAF